MTRSGPGKLLRKPEQPPRATFLELFFDLVFVFAFARVAQELVDDVTAHRRSFLAEAGETLLVLLALLLVWFVTAWLTDLYNPVRPEIQLVVTGTMFGAMVMGLALPNAFSSQGLAFAGAYVAIHVGRGLVLVPALRGQVQRRSAGILLWFAVSAVPWIVGAVLPETAIRGALWALALAIDYTADMLFYPTPWRINRMRTLWPFKPEHMAERFRQFFIIALGELILIAGTTYGTRYFGGYGSHTVAFVVAFITTVLIWRIYTCRAGEVLPTAVATAPNSDRLIRQALMAHLLMAVGIVAASAGYGLVIEHPLGHTDGARLAFILGGPALFLAGRALFEHTVLTRTVQDRQIGVLVLAALTPAMLFVPPLAAAAAAMAVLAGVAIAGEARSWRLPSDMTSSPAAGSPESLAG